MTHSKRQWEGNGTAEGGFTRKQKSDRLLHTSSSNQHLRFVNQVSGTISLRKIGTWNYDKTKCRQESMSVRKFTIVELGSYIFIYQVDC